MQKVVPGFRSAALPPGRQDAGRRSAGPAANSRAPTTTWAGLRRLALEQAPALSAPDPGGRGLCPVCHGPAVAGRTRCFACDLHVQCARTSLADVVVPVAFAVKGGPHARRLWQYKSARPRPDARAAAAARLQALLLVFLRDHGPCLWRAARIPGPTHLVVIPSARGRPGAHPLRALVEGYLAVPLAPLAARSGGEQVRDLDPDRFCAGLLPGARVLLLDDTWTTGSSAQSAAIALRRAGADAVVAVVLGRHVDGAQAADVGPAAMPFRPGSCAVHHDAAR